jgi:DNA mismatch repair protein MutL
MTIHKLPDYVINRLKAWEIVERPSSILKELVENSLDAWAQHIEITINDWWKSFLSVQDDWTGIELSDMDLLLERYATSKIQTDEDLYNISSYWFRGEALASISEVSKITVITKTKYSQIWTKLQKKWWDIIKITLDCFIHNDIYFVF